MTLHDPAVDLEEIMRNVASRLHHRYPLVDPDEIDAMVADAAAESDRRGSADQHRLGRAVPVCRWCSRAG